MGEVRAGVCDKTVWNPELKLAGLALMPGDMMLLVQDRELVLLRVQQLREAIPAAWRDQCTQASPADIALEAPSALPRILGRLGWRLPVSPTAEPSAVGHPAPLKDLAVSTATALQLGGVTVMRHAAHVAFVGQATGSQEVSKDAVSDFRCVLEEGWRLKWENGQKEVLWRLSVDGVRSANARTARSWSCPCCPVTTCDPRLHCFWHCPIAEAVIHEICISMPLDCAPITRAAVWLCSIECDDIYPDVWLVVCMAALSAMEHGRRQLWRLHREVQEAGPPPAVQLTLQQAWYRNDNPVVRPPTVVSRASALAVADFWGRLGSFAALRLAPESWLGAVGATHPFLCHGGNAVRRQDSTFFTEPELEDNIQGEAAAAPEPAAPPPPARQAATSRQLTLQEAWARANALAS